MTKGLRELFLLILHNIKVWTSLSVDNEAPSKGKLPFVHLTLEIFISLTNICHDCVWWKLFGVIKFFFISLDILKKLFKTVCGWKNAKTILNIIKNYSHRKISAELNWNLRYDKNVSYARGRRASHAKFN